MVTLLPFCKRNSFSSQADLVDYFIESLNKGDRARFKKSLMSRETYVREVYPQTRDSKSGLTGDDFWDQFIALQRPNAVEKYFQIYHGCKLLVRNLLPAKEILNEGTYRFHKRVGVVMDVLCQGRPIDSTEDRALFGIIIEDRHGQFSLMNVARD